MIISIEISELDLFKDYFGSSLKIKNKMYCDITQTDRVNVEFPCAGMRDAFFLGRLIQNEKLISDERSKFVKRKI